MDLTPVFRDLLIDPLGGCPPPTRFRPTTYHPLVVVLPINRKRQTHLGDGGNLGFKSLPKKPTILSLERELALIETSYPCPSLALRLLAKR